MDALEFTNIQNAGVFGGTVAAIVALIVWLIKGSFSRQTDIADKYFAHLEQQSKVQEERDRRNQESIQGFAESNRALAESMREISGNLREHTNVLKGIQEAQRTTIQVLNQSLEQGVRAAQKLDLKDTKTQSVTVENTPTNPVPVTGAVN